MKPNWKKARATKSIPAFNLLKQGDPVFFTEIENNQIFFIVIFQDFLISKEEFSTKFKEEEVELRAELISSLDRDFERRRAQKAAKQKAESEEEKRQLHISTLSEAEKAHFLKIEEVKKLVNIENKSKTKKDKVVLIYKAGLNKKDVLSIMPIDFSYLDQIWEESVEPLRRMNEINNK